MQDWKSRLRFRRVENQPLHSYCGEANVSYPFKVMNLQLEQDFVNNIYFERDDILIIAMESGIVVLFSISRNKPISIIQADLWVSSVLLKGSMVWTVGKKRQIQTQHYLTGNVRFKLQEPSGVDGYYDNGIIFQRTNNPSYFVVNTGFFTFKLINLTTRRVVRKVDLMKINPTNAKHSAIKEFYTSKTSSLFFYITHTVNLYTLRIFDYMKMRQEQEITILPWVDPERFRMDSYHLLVSMDESLVVVLFQITKRQDQEFFTYATILTHRPQSRPKFYSIRRVKRCPHLNDLITCKQFCDKEVLAKDKLIFAVGLQQGFTETYAIDKKTLDIEIVELLSKSDHMITAHLVAKNVSFSSSLNGEITVLDIRDLSSVRFGAWYSNEKFIEVKTDL